MKLKIPALLIILCLSFGLMSCADSDTASLSADQANAYFAVFEKLYEDDPGLNAESKYLAVDLTNVKLADTTKLVDLIQGFCDSNGYTLLQDTHEGLAEKGYIKDLYFEEGFLISFSDKDLSEDTLVTAAQKWRSGLGAIGAEYTVKKKNDTWEITKTDNSWIS